MKKFFLLICLSILTFCGFSAQAAVKSVVSPVELAKHSNTQLKEKKEKKFVPLVYESEEEFWEDRIEKAFESTISADELEEVSSFNMSLEDEHIEKLQESRKPFFQKIYEEAINRVSNEDEVNKKKNAQLNSIIMENINYQEEENSWKRNIAPNYPTVTVDVGDGEPFIAPAVEHIPYFTSEIELLADGSAKITERITVVANGEKLKEGLSRAIPKTTVARDGKTNNIELSIVSVRLDNKPLDYKVENLGNILKITPKENYTIEPGIHNYEFEYIVSRQLWEYDDFNEFYWNINGQFWNLTISRIGAIIILPGMDDNIGATSFITRNHQTDVDSTRSMKSNNNNVILFMSKRPLFYGESMQILTSMKKNIFLPSDSGRRISWMISDYGDIILSTLGFIAILGAYFISWIFISTNKSKQNMSIKKNPMILRYLNMNTFDKTSFVSFLLSLYGKNIIDITKENGEVSLIKLTDDTKDLSSKEKKALDNLFVNKESVLAVNNKNSLKISRAYDLIFKDTLAKIKGFLLKANIGYLMFSFGMILLVQIGIALLDYSYLKALSLMVAIDFVIVASILLFMKDIESKTLSYTAKIAAILLTFAAIVILSRIMHIISCLLTLATFFVIYSYTIKLSKKNGLIKSSLIEAKKTYEYLKNNASIVGTSKIYINNQADIYALDLSDKYKEYVQGKEQNKLDIAKEIEGLI